MTPHELSVVRQRLEAFAAEMFAPLARSDQRAKGLTYVRGLLLEGRRKSMQPMAERLGVDHQGLQQFVTTSTWDTGAVRARVARRAVEVVGPVAWVVDDTGFPKDGTGSPCVARQYSGTLGKVANCQIGVSVHAVTDTASCPLDWRLFVPASWDDQAAGAETRPQVLARRGRCGIAEDEHHRPKWMMAVEMLDALAEAGVRPPLVAADAGYGDNSRFRSALDERGIGYVVQVKGDALAHAAEVVPVERVWPGRGRPPVRTGLRYPGTAVSLAEHVQAAGRAATVPITWREGSKGIMSSEFVFLRVRPAGHRVARDSDGTLPERWLIAQWPEQEDEPVKYWLSSLPAGTDLADLVRLGKIRWRIEHDYRELKTGLGLDHFEGRSWTGWHRHVTLVTAAHLFITMLRLDPKAAAPA
ncbi:DDE transposase [Sphaerisporangium siamense]|uniref:SRSO17 transposase n=1 Tax=Sphaerisporangium siamense TaxID=795645 RepID=A0A7W7D220_9ACTN|nr:IS701 family transposase [Sphaerisporangium siamense]MBB4698833.1 SRSO17 transposase [Sphaerisporangium siamense]MBB4699415.1 SRSO17 transposase [Sphaerisporangium siamense]MBB4700694.1 SRSO17 transposase [Sphaerisporangium siamense]MBB4702602.1 SRSO17 transposase [Sphaerisporangium siamense]GII89762.1 DDE transposase [Sphaerisporangium siamense]